MNRLFSLATLLGAIIAGCAHPSRPPAMPTIPKALERQRFINPRANFREAVRIVAAEWHDPRLDTDIVYEHAWRGMVKEISFQDPKTAGFLETELQIEPPGRSRFERGVRAVRRTWANTGIDEETIYHYALSGLVRDLSWDGEMLQAWAPEYAKAEQDRLEGETVSIGLDFKIRQNKLIVTDVVPDSPADEAGIRPGDRILAIDDDLLVDKGLRDSYKMIRKPAGATVRLIVPRGDKKYRLTLACRKFNARDVRSEVLRGVGVIRILNFSRQSIEDYLQQLAAIGFQNVKGVVLDLRSSGGGLSASIPYMACPFLTSLDCYGRATPNSVNM